MSPVELVSKLFVENVIVEPQKNNYGGCYIVMREPNVNTKLKKVTISNVPLTSKAVKLDEFIPKKCLLSGKEGELSRCDYVLFVEENGDNYVYYIEMKSTKPGSKPKVQFKASQCLIKYCGLLAEVFIGNKSMNEVKNERFILFKRGHLSKRPTSTKPADWSSNSPDHYYERTFSAPTSCISFNELR
ncbi:MAG: hypothetical protein PHO85_07655 [Candidatus Cloacimonetes bacterium]|nr:hypothetical protein [Candidatus Cloacimonadota bacterium]MDD4148377.1 hypothetical protein [Candidatus Cloacimonadota bacterium]